MRHLTILFLSLAMVAGCGVNKKVHQRALDGLTTCQGQLAKTEKRRDEFESQVIDLQTVLGALKGDKAELTQAQREAAERITKLNKEQAASQEELRELRKQRDAYAKRMNAYKELTGRFQALVDTGKLKVEFRNGRMVLKLPSEILFASGRADLSSGGQTALAEVLAVLKEFKDRRFLVAGHTDNVPVSGRRFKDNWALSTGRAISVVRFMLDAGFPANNIGAAGYGEHDPVAPNTNKESRAQNRRIEIILVPDLSELPGLTVPGAG